MDVRKIMEILPHRFPFLLVDRVVEVEEGKRIVAIKNVTINEPFFQGHFPGQPIMPGVLIIEAMAQAGGLLFMTSMKQEGKVVLFMGIDRARFRKPVVPGDVLRLEVEAVKIKGKVAKMAAKAYVGETLAAEAELMATVAES